MTKHLFECGKCGAKWAGRPIAMRKNVRTDDSNKSVVKCSSCGEYAGYFVSEKVPTTLLKKKSIGAKHAAEVKADVPQIEKDVDDTNRLLEKVSKTTSLQHGLSTLSKGGEIKFEDLLKYAIVDKLGKADNPNAALMGIQRDIDNLRRDIADAKKSAPVSRETPSTPPKDTAGELVMRKLVESLPLSSLFSHDSGLQFNTLSDLKNAAQYFQSSSGRNVLDLEFEKARLEGDAKREEAKEKREWHTKLLNVVASFPKDLGWNIGSSLAHTGMNRIDEKERMRSNPHRDTTSSTPISVAGKPVKGNSNLLKLKCPTCKIGEIIYESGCSRVLCPNPKCGALFTILPEVEHPSRSPNSESPRPAEVEYNPQTRQSSKGLVTGEKDTAIGRGAKGILESGDNTPRRRGFIDSLVGGK